MLALIANKNTEQYMIGQFNIRQDRKGQYILAQLKGSLEPTYVFMKHKAQRQHNTCQCNIGHYKTNHI